MSSGDDKVRFYFCFDGQWVQVNNGWDYVNSSKHGVKLPANVTYRKFLGYAKKTAGIDSSIVGETKLIFLNDGEMTHLCDDEDVSGFLNLAGRCNRPPSVVVYVDTSMYDEGPDEDEAEDQPDSQIRQTYEIVPETQEVQEQHEEVDDDDARQYDGFDEDERYVFASAGLSTDDDGGESGEDAYHEEPPTGYPNNISYGGLNDYYDMPPPLPTTETFIEAVQPAPYNRSRRISEHQIFETKNQMIEELGIKFMEEHFQFRTKKSTKTRYEVVCKIEGCRWRMTAASVGEPGGMFFVKKLDDLHTCSTTQLNTNHRQANTNILGNMLKDKYGDASRQLRPKDIVADMYLQYGVTLTYHQAWRARCKALLLVRGTHAESFERLPMYLYNLELQNPGTRTQIWTDSRGRFEMCFVALGCAVRIVISHMLCLPIK